MAHAPTATEAPEAVAQAWRARGWPDDLLARAVELRTRHNRLLRWASDPRWTVDKLRAAIERRVALADGALRVREATARDAAALVDLYADAPQDVGAWNVTVERGPNPFAQFLLQENAHVHVIDHDGALLATAASSRRTSVVDGREVMVHMPSAFRARSACRSEGLGPLVQRAVLPQPGDSSYYYRRERRKPGLRATILLYPRRSFDGDPSTALTAGAPSIRSAQPSDLAACVQLINRTHRGLDLFRPYGETYLQAKLNGTPDVYTWRDYYIAEEDGRIVACAGLWDRGRHMRERWVHKTTGERRLVENTALCDFGFAEGHESAMATLISHQIGVTDSLGRGHLMAPLEFLPDVVRRLAAYEPVSETRPIYWQSSRELKELGVTTLTKPYTDLAYW